MIPPNIQKWIDALKSSKYSQTKVELKTLAGKMCASGVACDISGLGRWERISEDDQSYAYIIPGPKDRDIYHIPIPVLEWLGMGVGAMKLIENLNDYRRYDFDEIADYIEREWMSLVTEETWEKYGDGYA